MSKYEKKLTEQERIILNHELEEWRYLNDYVNKMDMGYMQLISLLLAIITGIMAIIFSNKQIMEKIEIIFFLIPVILISVFGYMSYQFRITAILRGHLASLEKSMNQKIGKNVHMWNSALVETFMAHNNSINSCLMPINLLAVIIMVIISWLTTWNISANLPAGKWIFIIYWCFIGGAAVIVAIPFFYNDRIRYATEDTDTVYRAYQKYKAQRKEKKYKYKGIDVDKDDEGNGTE